MMMTDIKRSDSESQREEILCYILLWAYTEVASEKYGKMWNLLIFLHEQTGRPERKEF